MRRKLGFALLPWLMVACAPAAKSPTPVGSAKPALAATPEEPRERLVRALRAIPRPEPVLLALPLEARSRLQARLASLDAERRMAVRNDDSPVIESLPLLHLTSGGSSARAMYALATTPAGSGELPGILGVEGDGVSTSPDAAHVAIAGEIARRAALDFLRDRAADVAEPGKSSALACRLVARAALTVERRDLTLLARELLASSEPNSDNRLDFAAELARSGELQRAQAIVGDRVHPLRAGAAQSIEPLLEAARIATAPASTDVTREIARARAWLRLGRPAEARTALQPFTARAASRLDLATTLAVATIENPGCPELPPDVGSAPLCAAAYRTSERVKSASAPLSAAWQSGAGRDDLAIEAYVGLALVVPWLHQAAADLSRNALSVEESVTRLASLRAKIAEIAVVAPKLAGLVLFLEAMPSAARAGGINEADAKTLSDRASALSRADTSRFAQAGVLAVAAALSHRQDIASLLDTIPADRVAPSLAVSRAALEVWTATSTGSNERMAAARSQLATIMAESRGNSLERSRLVLGVTEADAVLDPSERSFQLLSRVSGQLLSDNVPPDLALRAVLDASGALAHGSRYEQAGRVLEGAVGAELPSDASRAHDLLILIRGYKVVLGTQGAPVTALPGIRAELARLASDKLGDAATVWFELWKRELEALQRDSDCKRNKQTPCRAAEALRKTAYQGFVASLGAPANAILLRGALPSGAFDAGFRFTIEGSLEPLVSFDPSFLAIGLPEHTPTPKK